MSTQPPMSYGEFLEFLDQIPIHVFDKRRRCGLSQRDAAAQMDDVSASTLARVEDGHDFTVSVLRTLIAWLSPC